MANYAAVLDLPPDHPDVARTARRAFANYGEMVADFCLLPTLSPAQVLERMSEEGREAVDRAVAAGRGAILALPHMGSWDYAGAYAASLGIPTASVAERFPGSLDRAVREARTRFGLEIIPLDRAAVRGIARALGRGKVLALLCDLPPPEGRGTEVVFFGRRAVIPSGPAAFAVRMGLPLIPVAVYRRGRGRYHVRIGEPLWAGEGDRKTASQELSQRMIRSLEGYIRERPEDWYAFKRVLGEPVR